MDAPHQDVLLKLDGRFLFVDNVRFWCMVAVLSLHCTRVFTLLGYQNFVLTEYVCATLFKFGTIGFFLVSGFLLESNLATRAPWPILRKRLGKVFVPWIFWFLLTYVLFLLDDLLRQRAPFAPGFALGAALAGELTRIMTATSLWFVPNLFFGLCVLLAVRRLVDRMWFGVCLLAIDLFYVANIYGRWSTALHAEALFGFIFYLWLGHFAARRQQAFGRLVLRLRLWQWGLAALGAGAAALGEARWLAHLGADDPLNTLRPLNQIFSVLVVLGLCRLRRAAWPRWVDVPRQMFGVYLSHSIVVACVLTGTRHLLDLRWMVPATHSVGLRMLLWAVAAGVTGGAGWLLSRALADSRSLCWLLGVSAGKAQDPVTRAVAGSPPLRYHPR
jgi:hypothetical protein